MEKPTLLSRISPPRPSEEFADAVRKLTPMQWSRLRRVAAVLAAGTPMDGGDIAQEAVVRVLSGSRPWPLEVPLMAFLVGVMKSVASGEKAKAVRGQVRNPLSLYDANGALAIDVANNSPVPEEQLLEEEAAAQRRQKVMELFDGDYEAQILVEGIMDGMEGEELRAITSLDKTAFASKRRLIKRRLSATRPEGGRT